MSFKARFAEVSGKQFARFPWLLGVWAERIAGFGIREGCLAVTVPGANFTAHRVLFLISFPVMEPLSLSISRQVCQTSQKAREFSGRLILHAKLIHMTKSQERVAVTIYFLYWKPAASHSQTSSGKCVSWGRVVYFRALTVLFIRR